MSHTEHGDRQHGDHEHEDAGLDHDHPHEHVHGHGHAPGADGEREVRESGHVLTIRMHSGLSGDMFLAGLLVLTGTGKDELDRILAGLLPELAGSVELERAEVHGIGGHRVRVTLPSQHAHRTLVDVRTIIGQSALDERARALADRAFTLLAEAEGKVHGKSPEEVHFHEVGALDSILDTCLSCELFVRLGAERLVASPLPMGDGQVRCAHGVLPVPAPAVLELMDNVPVKPFPGEGETVTPTAMALLRAFGASFGPWPCMLVEKKALAYGCHEFDNAPNGALFAFGRALG